MIKVLAFLFDRSMFWKSIHAFTVSAITIVTKIKKRMKSQLKDVILKEYDNTVERYTFYVFTFKFFALICYHFFSIKTMNFDVYDYHILMTYFAANIFIYYILRHLVREEKIRFQKEDDKITLYNLTWSL